MPKIFKHFTKPAAEDFVFPDAEGLKTLEELPEPEEPVELPADIDPGGDSEPDEAEEEAQEPVSFAQIQAEKILADAQRQVQELLDETRARAEAEAEEIRRAAENEGYQAGYADGAAQALREGRAAQEQQAAQLEAEIQKFFDKAGDRLDRHLDESVDDLRDLALAVAEKVVSVSLRSSSEVIARMIQAAIDKRKRREWVHIYIAECDAKRMGQVPAALAAALTGLSDRVRIIPMADDEPGTCIVEMPDEIIDASAATQMGNIRSLLMDTRPGAGPIFRP
ncbi:MAG: F0F1 ATP synthase subunit delta [Oscillospiraceae bacterium]|nr:F0F1 ATP synthase subunit delta [Oscillospiraceae bacterium]